MFWRLFHSVGYARLVALILIGFALFVRWSDPIPVKIVRDLTFDTYQRILPREPQDLPVAIIDVDDASLSRLGQWPWPRTVFAELIDKLSAYGVRAIAFDIVFAEPDRLSPGRIALDNDGLSQTVSNELSALPDNDAVLADAFSRSKVVVGQTNVRTGADISHDSGGVYQVSFGLKGPDPVDFIQSFPELVENLPELENTAAGRGMFSIRPDPDGVYRNTPMVMLAEGQVRLGLAPELLRVATGGETFILHANEAGVDGITVARTFFQTYSNGAVRPYLTHSQPERFISAVDVLQEHVEPSKLAGKLVFVGTSAVGLEDYRATPFGVQVPGVELHAQLLENLITQSLLQRPNYTKLLEMSVALGLCLLIVILTPIMSASILALSSAILLTATGFASFEMFRSEKLLIDASFPILAGLATIIFMSTTNYLREETKRREIRSAFGQYVSSDLVATLADSPERLSLGGETRPLTLLFSDVRGFTSIAESYREDPEGLTTLMNRLLSTLSDAILKEQGTIDKFIGDAVMAFWNAPLDHEDHARAACRAALNMRDDIVSLNARRQKELGDQYQEMRIGIGISTGSCLVGNMGSDKRFDYTAMGDPVNLASRLEGQTSFYGQTIMIGAATEQVVRDDFALLELDLVRLKGKQQAERVFALLGDDTMRSSSEFGDLRSLSAAMLAAYRGQKWRDARTILNSMRGAAARINVSLDLYCDLFEERINSFSEFPLPADWDGVHTSTSK